MIGKTESTCTPGPQPVLDWFTSNDVYYGVYDNSINFTTARCLCDSQPGITRLAVLDREADFHALGPNMNQHFLGQQFWIDANRSSRGQFRLLIKEQERECDFVT